MTLAALLLQFTALTQQTQIMKNHDDRVGNNLFSFIAIMGIVVCIFKLLSDCLLVYGAKKVSHREKNDNKFLKLYQCYDLLNFIYLSLSGRQKKINNHNEII